MLKTPLRSPYDAYVSSGIVHESSQKRASNFEVRKTSRLVFVLGEKVSLATSCSAARAPRLHRYFLLPHLCFLNIDSGGSRGDGTSGVLRSSFRFAIVAFLFGLDLSLPTLFKSVQQPCCNPLEFLWWGCNILSIYCWNAPFKCEEWIPTHEPEKERAKRSQPARGASPPTGVSPAVAQVGAFSAEGCDVSHS